MRSPRSSIKKIRTDLLRRRQKSSSQSYDRFQVFFQRIQFEIVQASQKIRLRPVNESQAFTVG